MPTEAGERRLTGRAARRGVEPANFFNTITAPRTVTLSQTTFASALIFRSSHRYTITGPFMFGLSAATPDGVSHLRMLQGSHTIAIPFSLARDTMIDIIPAGSIMTISDKLSGADVMVTKGGAGTLETGAFVSASIPSFVPDLTINQGTFRIIPNGTNSGTSRIASITINDGTFDLTNNNLILMNQSYASAEALVKQGFNGGNWLGEGITSSSAANDTTTATALGIVNNAAIGYASFSGQTALEGDEILIKYTYYGDADLGGTVNLDDFGQFLFGYNGGNPVGAPPAIWLNGDFDYNGAVNLDDFNKFLFGLQNQGGPLVSPELFAALAHFVDAQGAQIDLSAVPEPTGAVLLAASLLVPRRRARYLTSSRREQSTTTSS